jgi:hypothetical protein
MVRRGGITSIGDSVTRSPRGTTVIQMMSRRITTKGLIATAGPEKHMAQIIVSLPRRLVHCTRTIPSQATACQFPDIKLGMNHSLTLEQRLDSNFTGHVNMTAANAIYDTSSAITVPFTTKLGGLKTRGLKCVSAIR